MLSLLTNPLNIPCPKSDKDMRISYESLPENPDQICDELKEENVIMMYYIPVALHYNKNRGMPLAAIKVLERGLKEAKGTNEDIMKINNLIACLNLRMAKYPQGNRIPSEQEKNELLNEATRHFNIASQISSHDAISWVGKGYLHLMRNDPNMALTAFTNATNLASNNIPALFGQARVYYHRKDYKTALSIYQQILQADPTLTEPDPRIGIGLCYNKLDNFDQALMAFDRALELNPNNVSANILVSTMELDISKQWQLIGEEERLTNYAAAMRRANKALEINPSHPSALILLAHGYYFQRDFEKLLNATKRAEQYTISKPVLAEAQYQQARAYHIMEEYDKAHYYYAHAILNNNQHQMSKYGYGQMLIKRGYYEEAKAIFENLRNQHSNLDVVTIIAILHAHAALDETDKTKKERIFEEFDRITKAISEKTYDNPDIFVVKALATEGRNVYKALQSLKLAQKIYVDTKEPIPYELSNKMGTLHFKLVEYEESEKCFRNALEACNSLSFPDREVEVTLKYNLARALEASHKYVDAIELYNQIISDHPSYSLAHLRLSAIEEYHGNYEKANEIYNDLLELDNKDLEFRKRRALNILRHGETRTSRKYLEAILNDYDKNDVVTLTALGSLFLTKARSIKQENMKEQREANYKKAVDYFQKALKLNPRNLWAANGITVALAETWRLQEAKEFFLKLRERNPLPEITINYAHVCSHLNDYPSAILAYESVSKKSQNKDVQVLEWLGRSNYLLAKANKDMKMMEEALEWTQKAFKLNPTSKFILHNIALLQQGMAQMISEPGPNRSVEELTKALENAKMANFTFNYILNDVSINGQFDIEVLKNRISFGQSIIISLESKYFEAMQAEEARQRRIEEERRVREEHERELKIQKEFEEQKKKEESERAAEQERIKRQELFEYNERQKLIWKDENGRKRKSKPVYVEDEDEEDYDEGDSRRSRIRTKY
ncbi:hypothetical protein Glove_26g206 [Diversispora epigaea]|uniref:Uncharacterized protein n=1 Tax=Diversispora epigaea TaxID=1348612 RepID=A0A397JSL7_9GLOM|nr:hypothetical protein Glove_26g206 [Diversispora epigaea]